MPPSNIPDDWTEGSQISSLRVLVELLDRLTQLEKGPFEERLVTERNTILDLKSLYGVSALRDITTTEGSATVTNSGAEYDLATTATANDLARLESARSGFYQAGAGGEAGFGLRRPTAPTGEQVWRAGYVDDQHGFFFGEDSTSPFIARRRDASEVGKTPQADWNVDPMDGTGPSGETLDLSAGVILRIRFTWYGFGVISWQVVTGNPQQVITVHRERVDNQVSVPNPNLPILAEVDNQATATAFDLFIGGRQFSILGPKNGSRRSTVERVENVTVSDSFIPLISFRRKAEFPTGVNNRVSAQLGKVTLITDTAILWEVRQGMSLTGASFGAPARVSSTETGLEVDTSATAASGGEFLEGDIAAGGERNGEELDRETLRSEPVEQQPVTLVARRVSGLTDASVHASFSMRELW